MSHLIHGFKKRLKKLLGIPVFESLYPWYDSQWLSSYYSARKFILKKHPGRLGEFIEAMKVFETPKTFKPVKLSNWIEADELNGIRRVIRELKESQIEKAELEYFGRDTVHNHPYFTELQHKFTKFVSQQVGEEVEPSYNFLSLYNRLGKCPVHMDAMSAKWTLDLCIDQSHEWPIYFSEVRPFLETLQLRSGDWQKEIQSTNKFTPFTLQPGDAIIFSGSSQWHFREEIKSKDGLEPFCHLVFFHFIPKGAKNLSSPPRWEDHFNIPMLSKCAPYTEDLL